MVQLVHFPPVPVAPQTLYSVAYFDELGGLWAGIGVRAGSLAEAWEKVQAAPAGAFETYAITPEALPPFFPRHAL